MKTSPRKVAPQKFCFVASYQVYSGDHISGAYVRIGEIPQVAILQDMVFENPTRTITDAEADSWNLRYYDTQVHKAAFVLPRFAKQVRLS